MKLEECEFDVRNDDGGIFIYASFRGAKVGRVCCVRTGERLKIGDLFVASEVRVPRRGAFSRLWRKYDMIHPRRQKLGATLLQRALDEARASGVVEAWGCVTPADEGAWGGLLEWYLRVGFTVDEVGEKDCSERGAKTIRMRL